MNTELAVSQRPNSDNDICQMAASQALDEVLAVFVDDGYERDDLLAVVEDKLDDFYEAAPGEGNEGA